LRGSPFLSAASSAEWPIMNSEVTMNLGSEHYLSVGALTN
jgi:hypothetical protein